MRSFLIPTTICKQMVAHAGRCLPEEACGLLGGLGDEVHSLWLLENELHSPVRFRIGVLDQWRVFREMEENGVELLGIFHSHPHGPANPSETDIAEFYYPESAVLILSPASLGGGSVVVEDWQIRIFMIEKHQFTEIELRSTI